MMKPKVCYLTSVHPRYDVRIFVKQCQSLAHGGYDVHLIVADSLGDEIGNKIKIYDVEKSLEKQFKSMQLYIIFTILN